VKVAAEKSHQDGNYYPSSDFVKDSQLAGEPSPILVKKKKVGLSINRFGFISG